MSPDGISLEFDGTSFIVRWTQESAGDADIGIWDVDDLPSGPPTGVIGSGGIAEFSGTAKTTTTVSGSAGANSHSFNSGLWNNFIIGHAYTTRIAVGGSINSCRGFVWRKFVSTLAGSGSSGYLDDTGSAAQFNTPYSAAVDGSGNTYVVDSGNNRIRKITAAGVVTTFAGDGTAGYLDDTGTAAKFNAPQGIALDASGDFYVADTGNHRIRKITAAGVVTTIAGDGTAGYQDASGTSAKFSSPTGIASVSGVLYIGDTGNNRIRQITITAIVSTLAGDGTAGYLDDNGTSAKFNAPRGIVVDGSGNLYVADSSNHRIRKIAPGGAVTTLAGSTSGYLDATGTAAQFFNPSSVVLDGSNNVYVTEVGNHCVRKITPGGVVTIVAGDGFLEYVDDTGTTARFYAPSNVVVDGSGNTYVTDTANHRIRKITAAGVVTTLAGGVRGYLDDTGTAAKFDSPYGIVIDGSGDLYVSDSGNHCIRKVTAAGVVTTFAGTNSAGLVNNTGTDARFNHPYGLVFSGTDLYVADMDNHSIRKVTSGAVVTTLAGNGTAGFVNDTGSAARFRNPMDVSTGSGGLCVADFGNHSIRQVTTDGVTTTLAGDGTSGLVNDIGSASRFNRPTGVTNNVSGSIYVADYNNHCVRAMVDGGQYVVSTLAGNGSSGYINDTGSAARFSYPYGITSDGSLFYLSDTGNNCIRKITSGGVVTTLAGDGSLNYLDNQGADSQFSGPFGLGIDTSGNLYVVDTANHRIRKITA